MAWGRGLCAGAAFPGVREAADADDGETFLGGATIPGRGGTPLTVTNHNNLLWKKGVKVPGVDGLKTGYIDAGGSSIVLTGTRGGRRAIVVVVGSASAGERDTHAARLLNDALGSLAW